MDATWLHVYSTNEPRLTACFKNLAGQMTTDILFSSSHLQLCRQIEEPSLSLFFER